jgi:hypothetical protein
MEDYDLTPELELKDKIKAAQEKNDFKKMQKLMTKLIKLQHKAPKTEMTDEELAKKGVDLAILKKERSLRDQIQDANQNGDFLKAKKLMRELRQLQKLQPEYTGVRLA